MGDAEEEGLRVTDNRHRTAILKGRKKIAENTYELRFRVEQPFAFEAGQYVWVVVPKLDYPDSRGERRAFSMANIPDADGTATILLRAGKSGFKRTLLAMKIGSKLTVVGPFGFNFCFPEDLDIPTVFVAGGTGIAPFVSLARAASAGARRAPVSIVYADASPARAPYLEDLRAIAAESGNRVRQAFVEGTLEPRHLSDALSDALAIYYVSGSQGFVDAASVVLKQAGIPNQRIRYENFYPTTPSVQLIRRAFERMDGEMDSSGPDEGGQIRRSILYSAVESSSQHVVITDINGVIVYANDAAERMTGFSFEEMRGNTPRLWGGLMSRQYYRDLWKSKEAGKSVDSELINRRKDGALYRVVAHISPIKDRDGAVIGYLATEEDISAFREAERIAREAKAEADRKNELLERMNKLMVGRELKMREMKQRLKGVGLPKKEPNAYGDTD